MKESLASQIVVDTTEVFFPDMGLSSKKVNRKKISNYKITPEFYISAVKRCMSLSDNKISKILDVDRSTVWRYRTNPNNKEVILESEKIIDSFELISFSDELIVFKNFKKIPIIEDFIDIMRRGSKPITKKVKSKRLRAIYNMCMHLNIHPRKLTAQIASDTVMKYKNVPLDKRPYGLSYSTQREALRAFFIGVHGIAGKTLTALGLDAGETPGSGKHSNQRVLPEQRREFLKCLAMVEKGDRYLELENLAIFTYNTGTRKSASLEFSFESNYYSLSKDEWVFEVIDKGKGGRKEGGGIKWKKILIGDALIKMKEYFVKRYKLALDKLEIEIPKKISYLYQTFHNKGDKVSKLFRKAFNIMGLNFDMPVHVFRHTFAQDMLDATDGDYELTASLGGWKNVNILKKHYGERSFMSRKRGLMEAMGMPIKEIVFNFGW